MITSWIRGKHGFAMDMDFYAAHASTVEPLPFHTDEPYPYASGRAYPIEGEYLDYLIERNSRHVSGSPARAYHYQYD